MHEKQGRVAGPADDRSAAAWQRYAWALFAVAMALLARWFADPRLGTQLPYGSMLVATIVISWFQGLRAALVVVVLGGVAANFFLLPPRWSFEPGPDKQSWGLVVFTFLGTVIALFGGYVHAQRARAEAAAAHLRRTEAALREARDGLEQRVRDRTAELAQEQRDAEELRRTRDDLETDNRRMQEALRLQNEVLANMSHELRTPLNAIMGFADLMYRGVAGPIDEQHREFLGDILTSSHHLLRLIDDMLDLARVESGTLAVVPQPVEIAGVIGEVRDVLSGTAASRKLELALDLSPDLGNATVDPAKLKQIVYSYVSNALKFTPEGGRVTIRAAHTGEAFRVEVEDTGIGIAGDDLRHLFVGFRQLDASAAKRYPGTGLGLALSKRLAEAHGGTVGVRSVHGAGSTFWVELPRHAVSARPRLTAAARG